MVADVSGRGLIQSVSAASQGFAHGEPQELAHGEPQGLADCACRTF